MRWLLICPILISFISNGSKNIIPFTILFSAITLLFFIWIRYKTFLKIPFPRLLLCCLIFTFLSLSQAVYLYPALIQCVKIVVYGCYFLIIFNEFKDEDYHQTHGIIFGLGVIASAVVYVQWITGVGIRGIFSPNPMYSATLLALSLIIGFFNISGRSDTKKHWWVLGILCIFPAILLLKARGPLVGMIAGILGGYLIQKKYNSAFYGFILVLFIILILPGKIFLEQVLHMGTYVWGRFSIWKTALYIISSYPFLGFGPGNFNIAYLLYRFPYHDGYARFLHTTPLAHNDFLQIGSDVGLPVLLLGCFVIAGAMYKVMRSSDKNSTVVISSSIIVTLGVCAMVNFPLYLPFFNLVLCLFIAHIIAHTNHTASVRGYVKKLYIFKYILPLLLLFLIGDSISIMSGKHIWMPLKTDLLKEQAYTELQSMDGSNYKKVLMRLESLKKKIAALNPYDSAYNAWMKKVYEQVYKRTSEREYLIEAIRASFDSIRFDPYNAFYHHARGELYFNEKDYELARMSFNEAIKHEPKYMRALLKKAECENMLDNPAESEKTFNTIFRNIGLIKLSKSSHPYISELLGGDFDKIYSGYAGLLFKKGEYASAKKYITRALTLSPENKVYKNNLDLINKRNNEKN